MILASMKRRGFAPLFILAAAVLAAQAQAAGSGMPWEEPLQQVLESVQGPVAKIIAVIIIITTGLTLAFGETGGGFRKLIQIIFGLSIAFWSSRSCSAERLGPSRSSTARLRPRSGWACSSGSPV